MSMFSWITQERSFLLLSNNGQPNYPCLILYYLPFVYAILVYISANVCALKELYVHEGA